MAWCPFAVRKPINKKRSRITPRAVILHTAVSSASSLFGYFSSVGDDSHFYVGPNGELEQYVDTEWSAYANRDANAFAISFESWDNRQIIPWNPAQLATIIKAVDWCCSVHGIPRRQIPTATGSGLGWHAMFGAPSPWTKAAGKVCPGGPRIEQFRNTILPRVAGGKIIEEEDMTPDQSAKLDAVFGAFYNTESTPHKVTVFDSLKEVGDNLSSTARAYHGITIPDALQAIIAAITEMREEVAELRAAVDEGKA